MVDAGCLTVLPKKVFISMNVAHQKLINENNKKKLPNNHSQKTFSLSFRKKNGKQTIYNKKDRIDKFWLEKNYDEIE